MTQWRQHRTCTECGTITQAMKLIEGPNNGPIGMPEEGLSWEGFRRSADCKICKANSEMKDEPGCSVRSIQAWKAFPDGCLAVDDGEHL